MTQTGTATDPAQQIIRQIETEAAGPHDLGCFETYADIAAETLGIDGDHDEVLDDGRTLMAHFHSEVGVVGSERCECAAKYVLIELAEGE
jgi:hypothetical protein